LKHHRLFGPGPLFGLAAAAVLAAALFPGAERAGAQATPPPPPVPGDASPFPSPDANPEPSGGPSPEATEAPRGRHHRGGTAPESSTSPEPSPTPTSPAFATLDGTWEMQLQYIDHTDYSYLTIAQKDQTLSGTWRISKSVQYPLEGTYDGRLIRMLVKENNGAVTLSGYVEGATDMVGILDAGNGVTPNIAFTAEHRASQKSSPFKKHEK